MGKRVKSAKPAIIPIENWAEADKLLRRTGTLQLQIEKLQNDAAADINNRKARLVSATKVLQADIEHRRASLEAFATAHKADFGKARSRKLNFGTVGWRQTTSIGITKKTTVQLIREVLSAARAKLCIIVKETVSKDGLGKLTDEELAELGARRKVKDDFFVEPDIPEAANYE